MGVSKKVTLDKDQKYTIGYSFKNKMGISVNNFVLLELIKDGSIMYTRKLQATEATTFDYTAPATGEYTWRMRSSSIGTTTTQPMTYSLDNLSIFYTYPYTIENCDNLADGYRFGFNGKEDDKETGTQDYGFRIYNPQLGKFLSVDPLFKSFPWYTPYQFAGNKPIIAIDLDGAEEKIVVVVMNKDKEVIKIETYENIDEKTKQPINREMVNQETKESYAEFEYLIITRDENNKVMSIEGTDRPDNLIKRVATDDKFITSSKMLWKNKSLQYPPNTGNPILKGTPKTQVSTAVTRVAILKPNSTYDFTLPEDATKKQTESQANSIKKIAERADGYYQSKNVSEEKAIDVKNIINVPERETTLNLPSRTENKNEPRITVATPAKPQ